MPDIKALIETSFAEAIDIILASSELSERRRRHWATSLRQIGKALGKPLEVIPHASARSAPTSSGSMRRRSA